MTCLECSGCTTDSVLGTETVEACEECGSVKSREHFTLFQSEVSTRQEPSNATIKTPIQKHSLTMIDGLIDKLKLHNSKQKCHQLFEEVVQHSKYKKRSRIKLAAACLVIASRSQSGKIPISLISSELAFKQSDIGRFVMKISRDFNIPSSLPNPKKIFEELLSVFYSSNTYSTSLSNLLNTAEDLYQFTSRLLNLQPRYPHIHACLYISLLHHQQMQNSAPNLSVFCTSALANKDTVHKYVSMMTNSIVDLSSEFSIAVTRKNFFHKIQDILKHQSVFLRYSPNQKVDEDPPSILPLSDPSHPIHDYEEISVGKEDESLSGITDSEIENALLCSREVEQKEKFITHDHGVSYMNLFPETGRRRAADV